MTNPRRFTFPLLTILMIVLAGFWLSNHTPPFAEAAALAQASGFKNTLAVTMDPGSGRYAITQKTTHWNFTGTLNTPLDNLARRTGTDDLGDYTAVIFDWQSEGSKSGEIRAYTDKPMVMFQFTCHGEQPPPATAFPTLSASQKLHTLSYSNAAFAPHTFKDVDGGTPALWFDDANHAAIFSPAANFMTANLHSQENGSISSGFVAPLKQLPDNFTHRTLLVFSDSIHGAWDSWGHALTDLSHKNRPSADADATLKYLGYWTDNGAAYYYNYDLAKGYTATLLAKRDELRQLAVPIRYMQLDSWWYIKTNIGPSGKTGNPTKNKDLPLASWNCYGGLTEYVAHKDLFPNGLSAFQSELGLPLVTHNRWVDLHSPYHQQYKISGVAAVDPKWWDHIVDYLKNNGVVTYEQDWLNQIYFNSPEFQTTTTAADAFTDNMARATSERGLTMQYCMALPHYYLQGSKYNNLTTVRVSDDRFDRNRWDEFLYTSQLASALGEWPFTDCFRSEETPNLLLATLSAGPIGISDFLGETSPANVAKSVLPDGTIVKPDTAVVPIDSMYKADASGNASPMIAAAYTNHGPLRTAYVFAYPRSTKNRVLTFRPADLGIATDAYVYEIGTNNAQFIPAGKQFTATFTPPQSTAWAYFIVAPVTPSGISLIGDPAKFVSASHQRIANIESGNNSLAVHLLFSPTETSVEIHGFAPKALTATISSGHCDRVDYDPKTYEFRVRTYPAPQSAQATLTLTNK